MKRRRKVPDHRCQGVPVLRDVQSGKVPVPFYAEDGSLWGVFDMPASLVARLEAVAKDHGRTFDEALTTGIRRVIDEKEDV